jgi:hypothetical protein
MTIDRVYRHKMAVKRDWEWWRRVEVRLVRNVMDSAGRFGVSTRRLESPLLKLLSPQLAQFIDYEFSSQI